MGAGTWGCRLAQWENGRGFVTSLFPAHDLIHLTAHDIAADKVSLWYNSEKYDPTLCALFDEVLDKKRLWIYNAVDDLAVARLTDRVYQALLEERRKPQPRKNMTIQVALAVARATSLSWTIAREVFESAYEEYIERCFTP